MVRRGFHSAAAAFRTPPARLTFSVVDELIECCSPSDTVWMMLAKFGSGRTPLTGTFRFSPAELVGRAHALKRGVHAHLRADRLIDARADSRRRGPSAPPDRAE